MQFWWAAVTSILFLISGWLKVDAEGKFLMPSEFILSKYLNVNISACEENGSSIGATFHGLLGPQDLKRKGNNKLLFVIFDYLI